MMDNEVTGLFPQCENLHLDSLPMPNSVQKVYSVCILIAMTLMVMSAFLYFFRLPLAATGTTQVLSIVATSKHKSL
ncbi:hypothetical protein Hanom_Chr12g01149261 [Helianthus anomalus]